MPTVSGTKPVHTKTDVFIYGETAIETLKGGLAPTVHIGELGEGITLFFMGKSHGEAINVLSDFTRTLIEYRDALLDL